MSKGMSYDPAIPAFGGSTEGGSQTIGRRDSESQPRRAAKIDARRRYSAFNASLVSQQPPNASWTKMEVLQCPSPRQRDNFTANSEILEIDVPGTKLMVRLRVTSDYTDIPNLAIGLCLVDFETYLASFKPTTAITLPQVEKHSLAMSSITPYKTGHTSPLRYGQAALVIRAIRCLVSDAGIHAALDFVILANQKDEVAIGSIQKPVSESVVVVKRSLPTDSLHTATIRLTTRPGQRVQRFSIAGTDLAVVISPFSPHDSLEAVDVSIAIVSIRQRLIALRALDQPFVDHMWGTSKDVSVSFYPFGHFDRSTTNEKIIRAIEGVQAFLRMLPSYYCTLSLSVYQEALPVVGGLMQHSDTRSNNFTRASDEVTTPVILGHSEKNLDFPSS
ncbi:uncharacterized protein KY384_007771 [Bacidia gigantensis]|uniref:uncharacterized protein n=1 Tax=Bacidia gigantensis TaxID=2732470 RepID=UPI001D03857D|nr:uncharacterized protein KY384_007771 [Bacidia gigantensis]KAG8527618.1 hypothetical protein KY384_007771 [Bacidia gigantensis]